ncbi:MAG TPA: cytochrome c biogenesis heme-transporting ATPase CcmA [Burkholderiaceae bacterium]|nr:cytochrome c biogenesis heme-transporting ATPase CcmA [Burkholderiaceae bacterium]
MTLQATQLALSRGNRSLFTGLDFEVQPGEALRIVGSNGSGKTSLLRVLCGLSEPQAGTVRWRGQAIRSARDALHRHLLYIGHAAGLKDDLTACENLQLASTLAGRRCSREQAVRALNQLGLQGRAHLPARVLSQGQRRRVLLARLAQEPDEALIVLDEPFNALDQDAVAQVSGLLVYQLAAGATLVYTSHHALLPQAVNSRELRLGEAGER